MTDPEDELLVWHWKLDIRMYHIKELMKEQTMEYSNGNKFVLPPVIIHKLKYTSKCPVYACTSCLLARSKKISTGTNKQTIVSEKESSHLATNIRLDIWCLQKSLWLITLVDYLLDMDESLLLITLIEAPFTMMPLPIVFELKIRYP